MELDRWGSFPSADEKPGLQTKAHQYSQVCDEDKLTSFSLPLLSKKP